MAEAAGLAFALLGAFNDAIQCFEYIQLARNFDQDFQTATLKLDIAKLRLSRWGVSVGLDQVDNSKPALPIIAGSPSQLEKAKDLLEQIVQLFKVAEDQSAKLKPQNNLTNTNVRDTEQDLDQAGASLHQKLQKLSLQRFKPTNLAKKARWALYREKYLNRLIQDITELTKELTDLFPTAQAKQKELCANDSVELTTDENISLITPLVAEQDPDLNEAIQSQQPKKEGRTVTVTFAGSNNYGLQQGYFSGHQTNHFGVGLRNASEQK